MLSWSEVKALAARREKSKSPVLSVFLNTDRSDPVYFNHKYLVTLRNMLRVLKEELPLQDQERFSEDARFVLRRMENLTTKARALVVYGDASENFFWLRELFLPLPNEVVWKPKPHVEPLRKLLKEHERHVVVIVDKSRARLFHSFLGELEGRWDEKSQAKVQHIRHSGRDHGLSQMQIQRKSEMHTLWHLKRVAKKLEQLHQFQGFGHLVLTGSKEATAALKRLLPSAILRRMAKESVLPYRISDRLLFKTAESWENEIDPVVVAKVFKGG